MEKNSQRKKLTKVLFSQVNAEEHKEEDIKPQPQSNAKSP
jgi:hypothetical protein